MNNNNAIRQTTLSPTVPSFFNFFSMLSPFVLIFMLVFISIINSNIKGIIYLCGVLFLFGFVVMLQQTLRHVLPHIPDPTCKLFNFPIEFKEGKEKNTFEPANFYTAIVIVCNKLGYNIPTPDKVDGKDIYKFKDITCSWKNNACYINLNNPCENITLDFTIMEDGSLKI